MTEPAPWRVGVTLQRLKPGGDSLRKTYRTIYWPYAR